jgi:hypothetical protein
MERSLIRKFVRSQVRAILKEADVPAIKKARGGESAKLTNIFTRLASSITSKSGKRQLISQVIQSLAGALQVTPSEVLKSYLDYKRGVKKAETTEEEYLKY